MDCTHKLGGLSCLFPTDDQKALHRGQLIVVCLTRIWTYGGFYRPRKGIETSRACDGDRHDIACRSVRSFRCRQGRGTYVGDFFADAQSTIIVETPQTTPQEEQLMEAFEEGAKEGGLSDSSWECVEAGLRADGYVDELAGLNEAQLEEIDDFSPGTPLSDLPPEVEHFMEGFFFHAFDPSVGCVSPSELSALGAAADFSDPETIAITELLTTGCQGGSLADCDMLFLITEVSSSAETVAVTCGSRNQPLDFLSTSCIIEYQSDPDYQVLVDECGTGFNLACDLLYVISPVGSENETMGASCGGQRDPEHVLPCSAVYGYGTRN